MSDSTPESAAPPTVTFATVQDRALDLLKNPVVLAGGTVILGIVLARLTAGKQLRENAARSLSDLIKTKATAAFFPDAAPVPEPSPPPSPTPPPAADPWIAAGKQILDSVAPNLASQLKKRLAEILPNQHN
jgi:hypothetical protein